LIYCDYTLPHPAPFVNTQFRDFSRDFAGLTTRRARGILTAYSAIRKERSNAQATLSPSPAPRA